MIGIIGALTTIATEFRTLSKDSSMNVRLEEAPYDLPRYLICMGYLAGRRIGEQTHEEHGLAWQKNFSDIAAFCEVVFDSNPYARICIIGSASGENGSYDMAYAGAKAAIHLYIRTKKLTDPRQQIVGIAPGVIADSGMTKARKDFGECIERGMRQRRGRWTLAHEVAQLAQFLLYVDQGAICNEVIRMDGGRT
jgi:NAD(P)-dependent dehydrogenase (short-subunit alcohol dehydrogenase family)